MKIIVIGSRAYNELVGRIEKIAAAIASLPEKGRAWNKEYINDEWMDGEQVCRYLGISGRTLQRLRSDHVITYSAINRKLYYSLTEIRRVLKERSVRRKKAQLGLNTSPEQIARTNAQILQRHALQFRT